MVVYHSWAECIRRITLQNVCGAHVDFSDDDKDGNVEGQSQTKVLFGHADDPGVTSNLYDKKINKTLNGRNVDVELL